MAKPLSSLSPGIDKRLSTWGDIQKHLETQSHAVLRPTITLSRDFGCEAFEVAEQLNALMRAATGEPWNVYDKSLLETVATEQGISLHLLQNLGDTARSLERLGLRPPEYLQHAAAFRAVAEKLVAFATVGNAIIVGRGGAVLCADLANCFHFRLEGSLAFRTKAIAKRLEMPDDEAQALVEANTKLQGAFFEEQLRANPHDRTRFHAVFNNDRSSPESVARAIAAFVTSAWAHHQKAASP